MNRILTFLSLILITTLSFAQSNLGKLEGVVTDAKTKRPIVSATIMIKRDGLTKGGAYTDNNGKYSKGGLQPGDYSITVTYLGYETKTVEGVSISPNSIQFQNIQIREKGADDATALNTVTIVKSRNPLIEKGKNQTTISSKDITKLATRGLGAIAATTGAVNSTSSGISFLGQRSDGTAYFVDGVRVIGSASVPQAGQGQIDILQSGIPAQFGDFTGGAISVTTKGPSRFKSRSLELISSTGLDGYNYNQFEGSINGPLWIKNKGGGDDEFVALAYQLAGNINYTLDASPGYGGFQVVNDDKLAELEENPLTTSPEGAGVVYSSSFLTSDDLIREKARRNVPRISSAIQGKIEYQPSKNTTITVGGTYNYANSTNFSTSNSLMNYDLNGQSISNSGVGYIKFMQRFEDKNLDDKEAGSGKSLFTDAYYFVRAGYQNTTGLSKNPLHGDNFFDYGYVGKFTKHRRNDYEFVNSPTIFVDQNGDTVVRQGFFQQVSDRDTLMTFERSDKNPLRANYTDYVYNYYNDRGFNVRSEDDIRPLLGLYNGFTPSPTYSLWQNPGANTSEYGKSMVERADAFAMGEASLNLSETNKHDLQFGMYFEQTTFSGWNLSATRLWQLMPLLANRHIANLDRVEEGDYVFGGIHTYDQFGNFTDTVKYNVRIDEDQQSTFDKNLRAQLQAAGATDVYGNKYTETSFIDVNSLNPEDLSLDLFSAADLLNNGNSYVGYYGYDYLGNRSRKKYSVNDFLTDSAVRGVASFAPIYNAVWLQDNFSYKDLILRLGVRVERYDANQPVLADRFSFYPITTASEVKSDNPSLGDIPNTIGDDYKVYVDDNENPSEILGFRNEDQWFDAEGNELTNPGVLATNSVSGTIQPLLAGNEEFTDESFKDYEPVINVLPRVWFSFPVNSDANFFANYDVMAQRPQNGATFSPFTDYFYMEQRQGGTIGNAALKPRIRTNYELGFKQTLSRNSALSIIASYSEVRGDYALVRIDQAYPISYNSYSNIDFSTSKNFRAEYEMRSEGRTSLRLNYTLLFADGTGSNINSSAALIQAGLPNLRSMYPTDYDVRHKISAVLDYSFEDARDYTGPVWFGKKVFASSGANFIFTTKSGEPFTADATPTAAVSSGTAQRSQIKGNPFGSREPWQFKVDANFNKSFVVKKKRTKDQFRNPNMNFVAFVLIQNLLNTRNVNAVYSYTGLSNDDGWLTSPNGQQEAQLQLSQQSYIDLYDARVNNPYMYLAPRTIRLGLRMAF